MKKRNQIDEKYKWKLDMFETESEIEDAFKTFEYLTNTLPKFYGQFGNKDKFFEYHLNFKDDFLKIYKLNFYISNIYNVDSSNTEILKLSNRFDTAYNKLCKATSFVSPQHDDLDDDYLLELLADKRAKDLDVFIKNIIKNKKHKLDEKTSQVIASLGNSFENSSTLHSILSDSEIKFEDAVDSKNKKHKVSSATYFSLISSQDRTLRKTAYNSLFNGFAQFNKTFAELYISNIKHENDFNKLCNYKNSLESRLEEEDVPVSVFDNNLTYVRKNIKVLQDFVKTKAKASGINKFAYYDLFQDEKVGGKISIQNAHSMLKDAISVLGDEYVAMVNKKLTDSSIDYMPNLNKDSGAYCSHVYNTKTLILMNWTDDFNSLSTLAHEMGHCINAEYYNLAQPMEKAEITIFSAEIASTVNEIILNDYMLKTCNKKNRLYYLNEFLDKVRSTIFRQTLFSEFEKYAHGEIEAENPITYQDLNKKYYSLCKEYYGSSCELPKNLQYEWSRIPHFYRSFYVYAYSTGLLTAICIANRILTDETFKDKYINFLKNGTAKPAVEILKEIGIDLTTSTPFEEAFEFIKNRLQEYKNELNCK